VVLVNGYGVIICAIAAAIWGAVSGIDHYLLNPTEDIFPVEIPVRSEDAYRLQVTDSDVYQYEVNIDHQGHDVRMYTHVLPKLGEYTLSAVDVFCPTEGVDDYIRDHYCDSAEFSQEITVFTKNTVSVRRQ
jgi:hypothetical protein